jgi:two-component system OmpR family sensor kinase
MLERLAAAFEAQDRFVQDASHELRTPLTIARGHLEVTALAERDLSDEGRAALELAIAELDRMALLADGLLRLARMRGRSAWPATRVDLSDVARQAAARARGLAERTLRVSADGPVEVVGDAGALEQVVLNLLANAVRHTVDGGHIEVAVRREGAQAVIEVTDDGEGIPAELLPHVFDRFSRGDRARGRDTGGTGLGLAICRAIVDAHGGTIGATSTPGAGARFTARLPAA